MGFGSTAKKLQSVVDMADELYSKLGELREQMSAMRETIETTNDRVEAIETELEDHRAILEAIAEAEGVDVSADVLEDEETTTEKADRSGEETESREDTDSGNGTDSGE